VLTFIVYQQDMGIQEPELVDLVHKLEELEQKLCSHRLHKVSNAVTSE